AADRAQESDVFLALHALNYHVLAELVAEGNNRAQDHRAAAILLTSLQEGAVDLDGIKGELVEIGERGIAGAKIVECQSRTSVGELAQYRGRLFGVLHYQRLGDLKPERTPGDDGTSKDMADLADELWPKQLPARNVDAHKQRRVRARHLLLPARHLAHRPAEHVGAELVNQVRLFGHGNEFGGIDRA